MSLKYQRIKQADLLLPAPLRWLTRAFSSITMAVILLACVALYGAVASVPFPLLLLALGYVVLIAGCLAATWLIARLTRRRSLLLLAPLAAVASIFLCIEFYQWMVQQSFFKLHRATVIYRLPGIEMTELEFYSWWPMKLILGLFVLNMIWATIRRIEFSFPNIGVLTVHTGIVTVSVGSILYGSFKLEGDTLLWRQDLGGQPVDHFYDGTSPALYITASGRQLMLPLGDLPRYNDYDPDSTDHGLEIPLHADPAFAQVLGPNLRATIRGFLSYADLRPVWVDGASTEPHLALQPRPALEIAIGEEHAPSEQFRRTLVAHVPAARVADQPGWAIEFLHDVDRDRLNNLMAQFEGLHGLVVEIPDQQFRQVYTIAPDQTITVANTGYQLHIEAIGDYGLSFATEGYQGATDTRAQVQIRTPQRMFRRIAMHRYPERSQDFIPPAPGEPPTPGMGPMGRRTAPDPSIRLTYIDASKLQLRLIQHGDSTELSLLARIPGQEPFLGKLPDQKFPVGSIDGKAYWLHIVKRLQHAQQEMQPVITPKAQRQSKDEGTYLHALVPVDFELPAATPQGKPWQKRIWLAHMRYPMFPDEVHRPEQVDVPGLGSVQVAFSRVRHSLPFSMQLADFEMKAYPGSTIPLDFMATLNIVDYDANRSQRVGHARLNNPLIHHGYKISQTGWDPGDKRDPNLQRRSPAGKLLNQQRYSVMGVGNNVGIRIIFIGSCMVVAGIPWAFYVKPWLVQRRKRQLQEELRKKSQPAAGASQA